MVAAVVAAGEVAVGAALAKEEEVGVLEALRRAQAGGAPLRSVARLEARVAPSARTALAGASLLPFPLGSHLLAVLQGAALVIRFTVPGEFVQLLSIQAK